MEKQKILKILLIALVICVLGRQILNKTSGDNSFKKIDKEKLTAEIDYARNNIVLLDAEISNTKKDSFFNFGDKWFLAVTVKNEGTSDCEMVSFNVEYKKKFSTVQYARYLIGRENSSLKAGEQKNIKYEIAGGWSPDEIEEIAFIPFSCSIAEDDKKQ